MTRTALSLATALFLAACGKPLATSSVAPTQLAPEEAFRCAMKAFQELGFQRTMYNQEELQTSARKENRKITFSNTQFRKTWDRLDVQIEPGESGTALDVLPVTEAEYFSQTGKTLEQLSPSEDVRESARKLLARCDGSVAVSPDSVPAVNP